MIITLGILFTYPLSIGYINSIHSIKDKEKLKNIDYKLKSAEHWNLTGTPIYINGSATGVDAHNWTWVRNQLWCNKGNGTLVNPYIIANVTIDGLGTGSCIEIVDSNEFFKIRNCTLLNAGANLANDAALELQNVSNGNIINNNFSNGGVTGILLRSSSNNTFTNNIFKIIVDTGFLIMLGSNFNNITNNTFNEMDFEWGIDLYDSTNNIISKNQFDTVKYPIELHDCFNTVITENRIYNSRGNGIKLSDSDENYISNNNISFDQFSLVIRQYGITIQRANENTILNNTITNHKDGINLAGSDKNLILGNTFKQNLENGIILYESCENTISGNIVNENNENGIYLLYNSDLNYVIGNEILGNNVCINESQSELNYFKDNECGDIILKKIYINLVNQFFTFTEFKITFCIYDENNQSVSNALVHIWWNGTEVTSNNIKTLGNGFYLVTLSAITVYPWEDPIKLQITISASGYEDKNFETLLSVDPEPLKGGYYPPITPFWVIFVNFIFGIVMPPGIVIGLVFYLNSRRKKKQ